MECHKKEFDEISLEGLKDKNYNDREELKQGVRAWACAHGFRVIFETREQSLKSEMTKVSVLVCSKKECPFFLEFRSNQKSSHKYTLSRSWNKHNHEVVSNFSVGALEITPEILQNIKEFRSVTEDAVKITKSINEKFQKNLDVHVIRYQLSKLKNEEYGHPTEDAKNLIKLLENDKNKRKIVFEKAINAQNILQNFCFMTSRMIDLTEKFADVLIMDTTFKTNRFGMPLLDVICVNNLGKSCIVFVAMLENSKYESFQ